MVGNVRSLLEDALGEQAPEVHKVLIDLFAQIDDFRKLPKSQRKDFRFAIDHRLDIGVARQQYRDAVTVNEKMLDHAVAKLCGDEDATYRRLFITKARCDVTGQVIMRRGEIGVDIPEDEDRAVLESPDNTRGRAYAPMCANCATTHPTILSYTAHYPSYVPSSMVRLFGDMEDTMLDLMPVEHEEPRIKAIMGEDAQKVLDLLVARKSRLQQHRDAIVHEILSAARTLPGPLLFATTRVKGNTRLAVKTYFKSLEYFLRRGAPTDQESQVSDVYGMREVGFDVESAEALVLSSLARVGEGAAISKPYNYVSKNGAHRSFRTEISLGIGISLQGMSYAAHVEDQINHPTYEEQRNDELEKLERRARDKGLPVDLLRETIFNVLNHS